MISEISQKIYETLTQDATLLTLLPSVKDGTNVWELHMPQPTNENKFPIIVFRVVSGSPLLEAQSLNAYNWFVEIDIVGNEASMATLWQIFDRVYELMQDGNMSSGTAKAYKCRLDFFNTDYDTNTLVRFVLTRWQIWSLEIPDSVQGHLS